MPFELTPLAIPDVVLVRRQAFADERGFLAETFRRSEFEAAGLPGEFVQENVSRSRRGVLRGLHYQNPPAAQGKLVAALAGRVFDVAVDIRVGSPTYGRHVAEELSSEDGRGMWIPPGFAHGFCVLSEEALVSYLLTAEHSADHARGIAWDDAALSIPWPVAEPLLSEKDRENPPLERADNRFSYRG